MNNYTVYMHICPNGKKYIGITMQELNKRWHYGHGYKSCLLFDKAIKKYGWNNIEHKILFTNLTKVEAEQKEIELISKYKTTNSRYGYNIENGGSSVGKHSEETKMKIGVANKGRMPWDYGKHHSKETRKKISKNHFGIKPNKETRLKMSIAKKGKKQSIEHINKKAKSCCKKIRCNELNKEFESLKEAQKITNIYKNSISNCLNGRTMTAGGYHWEYVN